MLVGVLGSREAGRVHSVEAVILLIWSYGSWEGSMANLNIGFGSPGFCSEMSFPSLWREWIKNCS